jgi:hypothetical protein
MGAASTSPDGRMSIAERMKHQSLRDADGALVASIPCHRLEWRRLNRKVCLRLQDQGQGQRVS